MSEKLTLENPIQNPTKAAYQVVIELVRTGAFSSPSTSTSNKADSIIEIFDTLKGRFEKLRNEANSQ